MGYQNLSKVVSLEKLCSESWQYLQIRFKLFLCSIPETSFQFFSFSGKWRKIKQNSQNRILLPISVPENIDGNTGFWKWDRSSSISGPLFVQQISESIMTKVIKRSRLKIVLILSVISSKKIKSTFSENLLNKSIF